MKQSLSQLRLKIKSLSKKTIATNLQRFFKTDKGDYGEGDKFAGLKVPTQRKLTNEFKHLSLFDLKELLSSPIHEERLISLFILVDKYLKSDEKGKEEIFNFYLKNRKGINNWDLVDLSAPKIVGKHLENKDKSILFKFAKSNDLWEKRISILSTQHFIKNGNYEATLYIAEILLNDKHYLIHKAVGWMLREVGNKDLKTEEDFLKKHYKKMPRTMLRYSIEKFPESKRKKYLAGKI